MILLLVSTALIGAALGLRYNVFVLIPTSFVVVAVAVVWALAGDGTVAAVLTAIAGAVGALQSGYFAAIFLSPSDTTANVTGHPIHGANDSQIIDLNRHRLLQTR